MNIKFFKIRLLILAALLFGLTMTAAAQTTAFTYQGRFTDAAVAQPTNGTYNMQFAMFDAVSGGSQIGAGLTIPAVPVVNGIFTVSLDYGAASFDGAPRFLQVTVTNVILSPRQEITSAPFAIRARRAALADDSNQLGGIDADQYVTGQVVRSVNNLTGNITLAAGANITITPAGNTLTIASTGGAGGGSGINNQTTLQAAANFNIDGTGAANVFNAGSQFNVGGSRVLTVAGTNNFFAGIGAGSTNTGNGNSFVGAGAGQLNTTGNRNSFVGWNAGTANTTGNFNAFFGALSGSSNTIGINNSFVGTNAGQNNTTANNNSFFGAVAGQSTTTGGDNTFVGTSAGLGNMTGNSNSFFGTDAGRGNTASFNSFFGRSAGFDNTSGTRNVFFGVDAGRFNTQGGGNSFVGTNAGSNNLTGGNNTMLGDSANLGANNLSFATALGSGAIVSTNNTVVLGRTLDTVVAPNLLQVGVLGAAGSTSLCRNATNQIATCAAGGGGGGNFIDNSTVQQPNSNFNVSGAGTVGGLFSANIVNSATNFRIGGATVLSTPNSTSVVAGLFANHATFAPNSTFFGFNAGALTTSIFAQANTFIGSEAGANNTGGAENSFVGKFAGTLNSTGSSNSFFGSGAGKANTMANDNSFFGFESGLLNSTGTRNSFFGYRAGSSSSTVGENTFFGYKAGTVNLNGFQNTFVGTLSGLSSLNGSSNSLFGYNADATGSKNISVGADTNANGSNNTIVGYNAGGFGTGNTIIGYQAKTVGGVRIRATAIGADAQVDKDNTIVLGTTIDTVEVPNLIKAKNITVSSKVEAGIVDADTGIFFDVRLLNTNTYDIPMCLSSVSKTIGVCPFNPIGKTAIGSGSLAETVSRQQAQINLQAEEIKRQNAQIEELKKIVCAINPAAAICGK